MKTLPTAQMNTRPDAGASARRRGHRLSPLLTAGLALLAAGSGLLLSAGCGGGGSLHAGSPSSPTSPSRSVGTVTISVRWPSTRAAKTRLVPRLTKSVEVFFTAHNTNTNTDMAVIIPDNNFPTGATIQKVIQNGEVVGVRLTPPTDSSGDATTTTATLTVPTGDFSAVVNAYANANGSSDSAKTLLATGAGTVTVTTTPRQGSTDNQLNVALESTIRSLLIDELTLDSGGAIRTTTEYPANQVLNSTVLPGDTDLHYYTVTAKDAVGAVVPLSPKEVAWNVSTPTRATLVPNTNAATAAAPFVLTPRLSTYTGGSSTAVHVTATVNTTDGGVADSTTGNPGSVSATFDLNVRPTIAITTSPVARTPNDGDATGIFQGGDVKFIATAYGANDSTAGGIQFTLYKNPGAGNNGTVVIPTTTAADSGTEKDFTVPVSFATANETYRVAVGLLETGAGTGAVSTDAKDFTVDKLAVQLSAMRSDNTDLAAADGSVTAGTLLQGDTATITIASTIAGAKTGALTGLNTAYSFDPLSPTHSSVTLSSTATTATDGTANIGAGYDNNGAATYTVNGKATITDAGNHTHDIPGTYSFTVPTVTISAITFAATPTLPLGAGDTLSPNAVTVTGALDTSVVWSLSPTPTDTNRVQLTATNGHVAIGGTDDPDGGSPISYSLIVKSPNFAGNSSPSRSYSFTVKPAAAP